MVGDFHFDGNFIGLVQDNWDLMQLHTVIRNLMDFDHGDRYFHNMVDFRLNPLLDPEILLGHGPLGVSFVERSIEHVDLHEGILGLQLGYDLNWYLIDD